MNWQIEKGVKIPARAGKWSELTKALGVGDSVLMTNEDSLRFAEHLRRLGVAYVRRKNQDANQVDEAYRVWRQS